jgi:hypothetical protein
VLVTVLVMRTAPVQAHHSVANFWEAQKKVSVTGVITRVALVNPHPSMFLDVTEDGVTKKYVAILGQGVAGLARYGITKETLAPGTKLTLYGYPPKASGGATGGILVNAMTLPDGKRIELGDSGLGLGTP